MEGEEEDKHPPPPHDSSGGGVHMHLEKLVLHAQRVTLCEGQMLEKLRNNPGSRGLSTVSFGEAFFSSMPLDNVLSIRWLRILCTFIAVTITAFSLANVAAAVRKGRVPAHAHYRFTNLESRNGSQHPSTPGIARFGFATLGQGGSVSQMGEAKLCRAGGFDDAVFVVEGAVMTVSGLGGAEGGYESWHIWTVGEEGTQGADALRFTLEGSDDMSTWALVGSSRPITYFNDVVLTDGAARVPLERDALFTIDGRLGKTHLWLATAPISLFYAVIFVAIASACCKFGYCKAILIVAYAGLACVRAAGGLVFLERGMREASEEVHFGAYSLVMAAAYFFVAYIFKFYEEVFEVAILVFATVQIAMENHLHRMYFRTPQSLGDTVNMPSSLAWIAVCLGVVTIKIRCIVHATRGIEEAKPIYHEVWQKVVAEQQQQLEKLEELITQIKSRIGPRKPRQVMRQDATVTLNMRKHPQGPVEESTNARLDQSSLHSMLHSESVSSFRLETSEALLGPDTEENLSPPRGKSQFRSWLSLHSNSARSITSIVPMSIPGSPGGRLPASGSPTRGTRSEPGSRLHLGAAPSPSGSRLDLGAAPSPSSGPEIQPQEMVQTPDLTYVAHNVLQSGKLSRQLLDSSAATKIDHKRLIRSLDHLHHQATLVHSIFLSFVVRLGLRYRGKFRVQHAGEDSRGPEFAVWQGDAESRPNFKLGGIKSVRKCITKADCCYLGDVSHLLDVCRETLYFENVANLHACLSGLALEDGIQIAWVKSNMDCGEQLASTSFSGMRFVKVCVRLVSSSEATSLGVETHLCELLLVLIDIARVQTPTMKSSYDEWRRCKRVTMMLRVRLRWMRSILFKLFTVFRKGAEAEGVVEGAEAHRASSGTGRVIEAPPPGLNQVMPSINQMHASHLRERAEQNGADTTWGLALSNETVNVLEGLCRMSGLGFFDFLDRRRASVEDGWDASSSLGGLWFSAKPVLAAMQRTPMQILWIGIVGMILGFRFIGGILMVRNMQGYAFGPYQHYRLETLVTRGGAQAPDVMGPGVSDFGILGKDRCTPEGYLPRQLHDPPPIVPMFAGPVGSSFVVSFEEAAGMSGWYLRTGSQEGSEWLDPAYYKVWGSNDAPAIRNGSCTIEVGDVRGTKDWCGARWTQVGAPLWLFEDAFPAILPSWKFSTVPVTLSTTRGQLETWILAANFELCFWYYIGLHVFWSVFLIWSILAARLRRTIWFLGPHTAMAGGWIAACVSLVIGGVYAAAVGLPHLAGIQALRLVTFLLMAFACVSPHFVYILFIFSILDLLVCFIYSMAVFQDPIAILDMFSGVTGFFVSLLFIILRRRALQEALLVTKEDKVRYDAVWNAICQDEESMACIKHLQNVIRTLGIDEDSYCVQHNRKQQRPALPGRRSIHVEQKRNEGPVPPLFRELRIIFLPGRLSRSSKVQSFNQLYAAAAIANSLLHNKIKEWAARTSGFLPVDEQDGIGAAAGPLLVNWGDVARSGQPEPQVKWVSLKKHTRAFEKLVRSYQYDPSKLLDISRNCIIFETLGTLTTCLGVIVTDQDVRVERVKNRMAPSYNSEQTGGYRDVCLNIRVVNRECTALGAEAHMCEVQLLLKGFAELKTCEGHKRYRKARDARGT